MESIIVDKINTPKPTIAINVKNLIKKMASLSFNVDAIFESKDWPYLWQKANLSKPVQKTFSTSKELAERKARIRRIAKISIWGLLSLSMYLAIFLNQGVITDYFTRGGFFSLAIVGTALFFALVHGTFTGYILENLNNKVANRKKEED